MKRLLIVLAILLSGTVRADELADANKLMENKAYPQAFALYSRLAQQGNVAAQFHLGEMYWYGEADKVDLAAAESWFSKAAASGSAEATAALATMRAHAARSKEITYWTSAYDGADLTSGKLLCEDPTIPAVSNDNVAIKQVNAQFEKWNGCYRDQVRYLQESLPPGKRIPADLAALMNQQEYDQAVVRIDKAYARVAAETGARAQAVMASYSAWQAATRQYVEEQNRLALREAERDSQRRIDAMREVRVGPPSVIRTK